MRKAPAKKHNIIYAAMYHTVWQESMYVLIIKCAPNRQCMFVVNQEMRINAPIKKCGLFTAVHLLTQVYPITK